METLVADDAQRADSPRENPAQQKLPEAEPSELQFKTLRSMVFLAPSFLADERWSGWRAGLRLPHGKSELMKGFEDLASLALKRKLLVGDAWIRVVSWCIWLLQVLGIMGCVRALS